MTVGALVAVDVVPSSDSTGIGTRVAYGAIGVFLAFVSVEVALRLFDEGRTTPRDPASVAIADPAAKSDAEFAKLVNPAKVIAFKPSLANQQRLDFLLDKQKETG
jgi:hypothetical protein